MKKTILFLLFSISCFGQSSKLNEYKNYLGQLDNSKFYSINIGMLKFKELFKNSEKKICDEGFVVFDEFMWDVINTLNSNALKYELLIKNEHSKDTNVFFENYLKELNENGIYITDIDEVKSREIVSYVKKDYSYIFKNFSNLISNEMTSYQLKMLSYENEGIVDDGGIEVSPIRLAERIIDLEKFISTYPNFVLLENCKGYKKWFTTLLTRGEEHSRVLNDNNEIKIDFLNSYIFLISEYPKSEIAGIIKPFYELLKQKKTQLAQKLLDEYKVKGIIEN